MTVNLKPEIAARLEALASVQGVSVDDYLQRLIERELPVAAPKTAPPEGSGMVWENGLLVYRTGRPLDARVIDEAIRQSREERAQHILGDLP
jgi:hypothetical protein